MSFEGYFLLDLIEKAMKKYYYVILVFFFTCNSFAQKEKDSTEVKSNPIVYVDFLVGASNSGNEVNGLTFGFSANYQINKDLFTFRSTYIAETNPDAGLASVLIVPLFIGGDSLNEFALLYGKRFVFNGSAISISAGVSSNLLRYSRTVDGEKFRYNESYIAVPFELNFNFFKAKKKRFRVLYGIIPVGQPTAFGRSFGVKIFGSLGEFNYFGVGLNLGLGWHKKY
ncbi:hypothetical protein DMZ43_03715 [Meridianimaribacter sp. CL38]|nr:hypothetical protein DMZ43_03715 [Meridianimaribacter sp. CL38]